MPVENERKFVLKFTGAEANKFENVVKHLSKAKEFEFRQGYLNENTRIREIVPISDGPAEYLFTYKMKVNGKLIEIETDISEHDFNYLWVKVQTVINKNRIKVPVNGVIWEVDFIKDPSDANNSYLVMAEVELPDGVDAPDFIPDFVSQNLLYAVPIDDRRFDNTRLSSPKVVEKILKGLLNGKH